MELISFIGENRDSGCMYGVLIIDIEDAGCGIGRRGIARDDILYGMMNGDGYGAYNKTGYGDASHKGYGFGDGNGKGKGWPCGDKEWYTE